MVVTVSTNISNGVLMQQTLTPKNDYFTAQFLLKLSMSSPSTAASSIIVDTQIIDDDGRAWNSGVGVVLPIGSKDAGSGAGGGAYHATASGAQASGKYAGLKTARVPGSRSNSPLMDKDPGVV